MNIQNDILMEFIDKKTIDALSDFLSLDENYENSVDIIAQAFGSEGEFSSLNEQGIQKLVLSFKNNLTLLIQKTWVEKSDIALKEQLLYKLGIFLQSNDWIANYNAFHQLIDQAIFLMFGQSTDTPDFSEYTMRIDPEFGIFWWYISNLPSEPKWSEKKFRLAMMLGMFFLANY